MLRRWLVVVVFLAGVAAVNRCDAQLDFLRNVFGGRPAAQQQPFAGFAVLNLALQEAQKGNIPESLKLAKDAFMGDGARNAANDPNATAISANLWQLCKIWKEKNAPAVDVAETLREIVLPSKFPTEVFPHTTHWQITYDPQLLLRPNAKVPAPKSVAAEMIYWSVASKQTTAVRERLKGALTPVTEEGKAAEELPAVKKLRVARARVVAAQLAFAERDAATASQHLKALTEEVRTANAAPKDSALMLADLLTLELLLHAVMPSLSDDEGRADGLNLLVAVLDRAELVLPNDAGLQGNAPGLRIEAARQYLTVRQPDAALKQVQAALSKPFSSPRYDSNYGNYLRRLQVMLGSAVLLDGGFVAEALDRLGPLADESETREMAYYDRINIGAMLGRELNQLPAAKRYELLRKWALPVGDRTTLRDISDFVPFVEESATAGRSADVLPRMGILRDTYSTSWHLLATARELGKLDEVIQNLVAVAQQTPQLEALRLLAAVMRDGSSDNKAAPANRVADTTARLTTFTDTIAQNIPKWEETNKAPFPMLAFVVATESARHREWRPLAKKLLDRLIEHTQKIQWDRPRAHVRLACLEVMRLEAQGAAIPEGITAKPDAALLHDDWRKLQPKHWLESGIQTALQHASGSMPGVWVTSEDYIYHMTSAYESDLGFAYPLGGKFEITFECREGNWSEGNTGYGGVQFHVNGYSDAGWLMGKGRSGYDNGPRLTGILNKEPWNRYTVQVDGDFVRYLANGQVVHEDHPGASAPWFTLGADRGRTAYFRNIQLTGTPLIPREITLLTDNRMRGWIASYYGESKGDAVNTRQRYVQRYEKQPDGSNVLVVVQAEDMSPEEAAMYFPEQVTDWKFSKGELTSAVRESFFPGSEDSWLYYQRPLQNGESLRYEFFHDPGKTDAHPTIGRLAYEFGKNQVVRHVLTDGVADAMGSRRPASTTLKSGISGPKAGWNSVEFKLSGDQLTISLNGEVAVKEQLAAQDSRQFGFHHDSSRTDLRVRNAVLSGEWPKLFTSELRKAFEFPEPTESVPSSVFINYFVNEDRVSDNAYAIYRRALAMDVKERYEFLHKWVIPNSSHQLIRMAGAFTPTHPAPPTLNDNPIDLATAEARQAVDQRMVQTGGNFVCPAILLVLAAIELDRVPELEEQVFKFPPKSSTEMARNRAALLGIIALLQDRPEEATEALWECCRLISDKETPPQFARWGDVALASLAIHHPVTREVAYELVDRIQRKQLQTGKTGTADYSHFVRHLHGQVHYLMYGGQPDEFGTQPKTKQWRAVSQVSAKTRGEGYAIAPFDTLGGELALRGGHDCDLAYFQSPLRGNYEVSCRLSHMGYREAMLMAAGIANGLRYTQTEARVTHVRTKMSEALMPAPLSPKANSGIDYKVVVRDGRYTSYVNGQVLHEAQLPEQPDPWLAVMGLAGNSSRHARNIVITGKPEIPSELELLADPTLKGWMTDYYGNGLSQSPFVWKVEEGVLTSNQTVIANSVPGRLKVENIIRYHRPMLEDGEISYEFFYDPETKITTDQAGERVFSGNAVPVRQTARGQTIAHPALDRMVCLIEPDGVKIHWLTDGRFDRTGLQPNNITFEPKRGPNKLPLRIREWNAVRFMTKGDELSIELNGQLVFTRPIDPTNLRHFGLFHYANESSLRVRQVRYRGDWPKTLPPVEQQELATGPEKLSVTPDADLPQKMSFDFKGSKFNVADFSYHWDAAAAAKQIRPGIDGLIFELPAGQVKPQFAGIHPKLRLTGDFIVTIKYSNIKTTAAKEGWGAGLSFKVIFEKSYETGLELRQYATAQATRAIWLSQTPMKEFVYHDESVPTMAPYGQLRLQRRGSVLYFFTAEKDSPDFRLVAQRPIGTNDVKQINIQADANNQDSGVDFTLERIDIRAAVIEKRK